MAPSSYWNTSLGPPLGRAHASSHDARPPSSTPLSWTPPKEGMPEFPCSHARVGRMVGLARLPLRGSVIEGPGAWIPEEGPGAQDLGAGIQDPGSCIQGLGGSRNQDRPRRPRRRHLRRRRRRRRRRHRPPLPGAWCRRPCPGACGLAVGGAPAAHLPGQNSGRKNYRFPRGGPRGGIAILFF